MRAPCKDAPLSWAAAGVAGAGPCCLCRLYGRLALGRARVLYGGGDACRQRRRTSSAWPLGSVCHHGNLCVAAPDGIVRDGFSTIVRQCFCHPLFLPYATYALCELSVPSGVAGILSVTMCSQLATLPVTIPAFGTFSLIAPLANAVIGPVISVLLAISVVLVPCSLVPLLRHGALVGPMIVARCACSLSSSLLPFRAHP